MEETAANTAVNAALLQSMLRVLLDAEVITPEQSRRVLDGAEKILADHSGGSRDEAATLELARNLMAERRVHWGR